MTATAIVCSALGAWIVLAALGGTAWSFVVTRLKRIGEQPTTFTDWTLSRPPVPESDLEWLDDLPAEVLSPREIALRCQRLEAAL